MDAEADAPLTPVSAELIRERVEHWRLRLGLETWFIVVRTGPITGGWRATCSKVQREYKYCELDFDPEKVVLWELDPIIIHEMAAHILTWPLQDVAEVCAGTNKKFRHLVEQAAEATTTDIERLILRLVELPCGGTIAGIR